MTKEINVEEAESWSKDEAAYNLEYLEARGRTAEVARINELRGDAPSADGDDYSDMTVDELQDELRERDLPVSGNKDELIQRLQEADG